MTDHSFPNALQKKTSDGLTWKTSTITSGSLSYNQYSATIVASTYKIEPDNFVLYVTTTEGTQKYDFNGSMTERNFFRSGLLAAVEDQLAKKQIASLEAKA